MKNIGGVPGKVSRDIYIYMLPPQNPPCKDRTPDSDKAGQPRYAHAIMCATHYCRAVQLDLQPSAITADLFDAPLGLSSQQYTLSAASDKDRVQLP